MQKSRHLNPEPPRERRKRDTRNRPSPELFGGDEILIQIYNPRRVLKFETRTRNVFYTRQF